MCYKPLIGLILSIFVISSPVRAADIVVLGDSLSAAYGLAQTSDGWVALLAEQSETDIFNASISGDTTSGGLARLAPLLEAKQPKLVIIELGGNDGLRGLSIKAMRENLIAMIEQSAAQDAEVMLVGVTLPPNYGPAFIAAFERVYRSLVKEYDLLFTPNLVEGLAQHLDWLQADGIHPSEAAQPMMMQNVYRVLAPWLATQASTE